MDLWWYWYRNAEIFADRSITECHLAATDADIAWRLYKYTLEIPRMLLLRAAYIERSRKKRLQCGVAIVRVGGLGAAILCVRQQLPMAF